MENLVRVPRLLRGRWLWELFVLQGFPRSRYRLQFPSGKQLFKGGILNKLIIIIVQAVSCNAIKFSGVSDKVTTSMEKG